MAKRRSKKKKGPKSTRCKNHVVFRQSFDCQGKHGKNACHPDYVKVGKSKYTARGGKLGDRVGTRGKVAICKTGRKLKAVWSGTSPVALRRIGR